MTCCILFVILMIFIFQMVAQLAVNLATMLSDDSVNTNPAHLTAVYAATAGVMTSRTSNYPAAEQVGLIWGTF